MMQGELGEMEYYKLTLTYRATPSFNPVETVCIYTHNNFHLREELHNRTTNAEATLEFKSKWDHPRQLATRIRCQLFLFVVVTTDCYDNQARNQALVAHSAVG